MRNAAALLAFAVAITIGAAPAQAIDPLIAAAGDIACDPVDANFSSSNPAFCQMGATASLIQSWAGVAAVLTLGDNQYENGAPDKYLLSYGQSWGVAPLFDKTFPVPGNHEYVTANAAGYFGYFGARANDPTKGWYSYDIGAWHLVALNANCFAIGGCGAGSPQEQWLRADLAANPNKCILAYWHHPRFSSGQHGDDSTYDAFWRALYHYGADVALMGHDHLYERFHRQTPWAASSLEGVKQFVVGTGGKLLTPVATVRANSAVRIASDFGVLRMTLHATSYDWEFVNTAGMVLDSSLTPTPAPTPCHLRAAPRAADYFTVPACRLADTRNAAGPSGAPALVAAASRSFPAAGLCGIPTSAVAIAVNATVVGATADGDLRLYARSDTLPGTNVVSFRAGKARASNATIALGRDGEIAAYATMPGGGTGHLVLDVSGYFVE